MTTTIQNFIRKFMEMIREGIKNITIYRGQSRHYVSIGKYSIALPTGDELKVVLFIICLILGGIVEGGTIVAEDVEIIREAVQWK